MAENDNNGHTSKADNNIRPPKYFVTNTNEDVARAWKLWLQQFEWYSIATNLTEKRPEVQVAVFMSCVGPDAAVIYNTFNLTETEANHLQTVKQKFTNHFTPQINETYERYVFNLIVQKDGQTFDEFVTELKGKVKNCGYSSLESNLLRDRLVVGIRSDATRERLLAEPNLTLIKAIDICHSAEQVKKQVSSMKQAATPVDAITYNRKNTYKKKEGNKEETFHCGRCDTEHQRRKCPAFKKVCKRCNKRNHFTKCCKLKAVDALQHDYEDGYSSEGFIWKVSNQTRRKLKP
ncbi:hypothetical protein ABMA27_001506 [Loxostege sticticalis]|uniref:Gag protein n=1 Tax=Loxostege sticticalis TaxID=481309 RepID=A0ABR3HYR0_LOXSC